MDRHNAAYYQNDQPSRDRSPFKHLTLASDAQEGSVDEAMKLSETL
jgi:hypothetical protein